MKMVPLKEWDWENERFHDRVYPYEILREFIEGVRSFNRDRDPDLILRMASKLDRDLTDYRNEQALLAVVPVEELAPKVELVRMYEHGPS